MNWTRLLQEIRIMRFEEAYTSWQDRRLTQEEAAQLLGVCERTFRRYIDRYEDAGLDGLLDRRIEEVSHRRAPVDEVLRLEALYSIECSMSGTGNCYDNAVVESWFSLLKRERVHRRHYRTRHEERQDKFDEIERFYNRRRPHGSAGRMSPLHYEESTSLRAGRKGFH